MIAGLKPYPAMRSSGVRWIGQVPEHWAVRRLRNVAELRVSTIDKHTSEDEHPVRLCNYIDVYKNDRIRSDMEFMRATATRDEIHRFQLQRGDVLITKDSETWNDIGVPALVANAADDLVSGYHLALLRAFPDVDGGYLFRGLQSTALAYQFHVAANGVTRYGLSHGAIKSVWVPIPPRPEQTAIVRFLDHADRPIQRYIRAKKTLIKLLEEQRQAIVHNAVTGGLNAGVRLKPSGVEGIGHVPEHWKVLPVKRAFISMDYGISESSTDSGTIRVLTMGNIKEGRITIPKGGGVDSVDGALLLEPGDLLFNRTNSADLVGKVGLFSGADAPVTFASYLVRMRPHPSYMPEYLNTMLNDVSVLSMARREAIPSLHQSNLNPARYGRLPVCLPPRDEQLAIVQALKAKVAEVDKALAIAHREITLLQEYCRRLIADVVTGKLDVYEVAARLPDGAEGTQESEAETSNAADGATKVFGDVVGSPVQSVP